jgi:pyruvate dehydrogenase E2 component (dihydrolipoamide acetyltransferase)
MSDRIIPITMPKWGLSMQEGKVNRWVVSAGDVVQPGAEVVEVESDKIAGVIEAAHGGLLRRQVAKEDDVLPVGALLGVIAESEVAESEIEAFITDFQSRFVPGETEEDQAAVAPEIAMVNGRRISYLRRGETGDPILLIHGFGGDKNNWLFNHEVLASTNTVYAVDLPGHGNSDKTVNDPTYTGFAKVILGFADALNLREFHLVGHSFGGAVSLSTALASPDRIKSVTLISSAALGKEIDAEYLRGFVAANSRKELKDLVRRLFAKEGSVTRQLVDDLLRFKRLDGVRSALEAIVTSMLEDDHQRTVLSQDIKHLTMPLCAIWGEKDRIIPASHAASIGKDVHILPNVGHSAQMEAANEVNRLLNRFTGS